MRALLLLAVFVWGWLGALPRVDVATGEHNARVLVKAAHDDAALVTRLGRMELPRALEARKPHPFEHPSACLGSLGAPPSSLLIAAQQVTAPPESKRPQDTARRRLVIAQPVEPRAPPSARARA